MTIFILLRFKQKSQQKNISFIDLFLYYLIFSAIYGALWQTENYWDWKMLVNNLMIFSLPLAAYMVNDTLLLRNILRKWFSYAPVIFILLFPFLMSTAYGKYLVPYTFLALFLPALNKKYILLVLTAFLLIIIWAQDSRSDVLKFTVCIILGITLYISQNWKRFGFILKGTHILLLTAPFICFALAITGVFNILDIEEELNLQDKYLIQAKNTNETHSALADTRTLLYIEQIESAIKNDYIIQGRSIARGYDSHSFGQSLDEVTGASRGERNDCEASILNIFNFFGLIGVCLYFIIFATASYKAIYHSRNHYIPIIGVYIAFRWTFAWIEDFSRFDLNYLFLWIMIGMCYSPQYRMMTDFEIKQWIKSITSFQKKHIVKYD